MLVLESIVIISNKMDKNICRDSSQSSQADIHFWLLSYINFVQTLLI